jgi:thioredoxin
MTLTHITAENFKSEVESSSIPVLIDFYADWCAPCKMIAPIFEALSHEYKGKVKFVKVDTEHAQDLAEKFQIFSIPTMVLAIKGKEVDRLSGYMPRPVLKQAVDEILAANK